MQWVRIKTAFLFGVVFGQFVSGWGQENLVHNPGFEGYPLLPDTSHEGQLRTAIHDFQQAHPDVTWDSVARAFHRFSLDIPVNQFSQGKPGNYLVDGWFQPTRGTTDYWNSNNCHPGDERFPPSPRQGGKIGMVFVISPEYIETRLQEPLEAGMSYYLEFYIRPPEAARWQALTSIGALFTHDSLLLNNDDYIQALPQVLVCDTVLLNGYEKWQKISGCFTARGGEQYLTIGCFDFYEAMGIRKKFDPFFKRPVTPRNFSFLTEGGNNNWWYYLLDDVYLVEDPACEQMEANAGNLTLLIDVSASMYRGKYMEALKQDIETYLTGAGKKTHISILSFAAGVQVLTDHAQLNDEASIDAVLDSLVPGGQTDIRQAIAQAYQVAGTVKDTTADNRIILLTDANFELDETAVKQIKQGLSSGIRFNVFHYGDHRNEALSRLVTKNGGEYHSSATESLQQLLIHQVECPCRVK